jgi:purine-cytosine permease-like protein
MDAVNDGSITPVAPVAARRAKPADHHVIQSVLLSVVFVLGLIGVVGGLVMDEKTVAIIIGLVAGAIITGTVC